MNRLDVLANNLANVDTTGFKRDATAIRSFTDELNQRIHGETPHPFTGAVNHGRGIGPFTSGVSVDEIYTDFMQGRLQYTGDQYNMAVTGNGFFSVSVTLPTGEVATRYTRDGSFTVDSRGMLVTKDGGMVLAQGGMPVYMPQDGAQVTVDVFGNISANGQVFASLQMVDFEDYTTLRKTGNNYFDVTEQTQFIPFGGRIEQAHIETSNINAVREMIEIINVSRIYEANARFVQTMDETLGKAVNEVGRR
jgi:flagellar basal-body rod protein FlgG